MPIAGSPAASLITRRSASRPVLSPLAIAGQRDQAAHPFGRLYRRVQRLAGIVSQLYLPDCFYYQAFRPTGKSRALARSCSAWIRINGFPGHELKAFGRQLVGTYLRVGLLSSQGWRTFKLRQDFIAAAKVQTEDDITASVVVPAGRLDASPPGLQAASYKFAVNCESRLFQRPDDAIHRGLDRQTEADLARAGQLSVQLRAPHGSASRHNRAAGHRVRRVH